MKEPSGKANFEEKAKTNLDNTLALRVDLSCAANWGASLGDLNYHLNHK